MNGLGKMASQNQWFQQAGGYYTFDPEWSNAQTPAGYPKDAILQHIQGGLLISVRSLVDNNTWDFRTQGIDGVHWEVCTPSALMFPNFNESKKEIIWTYSNSKPITDKLDAISDDRIMPFDGYINYISSCSASIASYILSVVTGITKEGVRTAVVTQNVMPNALTGSIFGVIIGITSPSGENGSAEDVIIDTSNPFSGKRNCAVFHVDSMGLSDGGAGCGVIPCKKGSKIKVFAMQTFTKTYSLTLPLEDSLGNTGSVTRTAQGTFTPSLSIEAYPIASQSQEEEE
jgi:hypothetical protein